jgi:antirestriction protein ArdC
MKGYTVFNAEQIDGLPGHFYATAANVVHGGSRACYVPRTDNIHMPCIDVFQDAESYYATRAHETIHNADLRIMPSRCRLLWFSIAETHRRSA